MRIMSLYLVLLPALCTAATEPRTSFHPGELWPDNQGVHINAHGGGILYRNGTYYWYGEHKIKGRAGNKAHVGVHVYTSTDLYNWQDAGVALKVIDNDPNHEIAAGCILERPKVIYNERTQKYVMWFHLELKGTGYSSARSGIATGDSPLGPFRYRGSVRPNAGHWPINTGIELKQPTPNGTKPTYGGGPGSLPDHPDAVKLLSRDFKKGQMARDMTLFVDDDGKAYHIYASEENSTLHISQLTDDYLTYSGKYARFFVGRYMEAPAIFKTTDGTYYFMASGCTGWRPNAARSARAKSIWGPWEELGNPCVGPHAELTFGGQSTYILPVTGKDDAFIFMADQWRPENAIDGRYVWLPIELREKGFKIPWRDSWELSVFDKPQTQAAKK